MAWEDDDFNTNAGTRLYISASTPTAETLAAFTSLTYSEITLTNVGPVEGKEWSTSTLSEVSNAHDREKKAAFKYPQAQFGVTWKPAEAGQVIANAASNDFSIPSFKLVRQDLTELYFRAQVTTFADSGGGNTDALTGTMTLLRQSEVFQDTGP